MLRIGQAVQWKKDTQYVGVVWEIDEFTNECRVEFFVPKTFNVKLKMDALEPFEYTDCVSYETTKKIEEYQENKPNVFIATDTKLNFDEYQKKKQQEILNRTNLNVEEMEELKRIFIDLALQTNDEEWFKKIMEGELL